MHLVSCRASQSGASSSALISGLLIVAIIAMLGACSAPPPDEGSNTDTVSQDTGGGADAALDTGAGSDATGDAAGNDGGDTDVTDTAVADAAETDTGTVDGTETTGGDAVEEVADDVVDAGPTDTGPPPKKLPLPDCAKNCAECNKCPDTPMCLDGKSYNNDCEAICELQAYDWPTGFEPAQGKCPDCKACSPDSPKAAWCATLASGTQVQVEAECELQCVDLASEKSYYKGPCKSACSQPPENGGGGCSPTAYQPVCSKKDGVTYNTSCAMQNCDKQGCFGAGQTTSPTEQCTPGLMVVECPGECYDSNKWGSCTNDCKPVCAIGKTGKAMSYRNGCIANTENAKVLSCTGVATTTKDKCSAELYGTAATGCCPDVDYSSVKQVCYSKGSDAADWMTFRNQAEFECLITADDKKLWTFQYQGPCIGNCPLTQKPVCGDDGQQWDNACQAKWYNGDSYTWKDGACAP